MDTIASVWDEAGDAAESADVDRRLATAKAASAPLFLFLAGAWSEEEFITRVALEEASVDRLAAEAGITPIALVAALREDWKPLLEARQAAAPQYGVPMTDYLRPDFENGGLTHPVIDPPKHKPGDHVTDFRGEHARVVGVYPSKDPGKSHRVQVQFEGEHEADPRHFYEQVFSPRDFHTSKKKHHPAPHAHGFGMVYPFPWPGFFPCRSCNGGGVAPQGAQGDSMGSCPTCGGSGADPGAGDAGGGDAGGDGGSAGGTTGSVTAERNVWGTNKDDIDPDYCLNCEHAFPGHYTNCVEPEYRQEGAEHRKTRVSASFEVRMAALHTALEEGVDPLEWIAEQGGGSAPAEKQDGHVSTPAAGSGPSAGQQVGVTSEAAKSGKEDHNIDVFRSGGGSDGAPRYLPACLSCGWTGNVGEDYSNALKTASDHRFDDSPSGKTAAVDYRDCPWCGGEGSSDNGDKNDADGVCRGCNGDGKVPGWFRDEDVGGHYDPHEGSLHTEAEYKYVKPNPDGDGWVVTQKDTGKVLSHHDSEEDAKASFRAMMQSKHGAARKTAAIEDITDAGASDAGSEPGLNPEIQPTNRFEDQSSSKPRQMPSGSQTFDPVMNGGDVAGAGDAGPEPTMDLAANPAAPQMSAAAVRKAASRIAPMVQEVMASNPGLGFDAAFAIAKQAADYLRVEAVDPMSFGDRGPVADGPLTTRVKNYEPHMPKPPESPGMPGGGGAGAGAGEAGAGEAAGAAAGAGEAAEVAGAAARLAPLLAL